MLWEVVYAIPFEGWVKVQWRITVERKRVADAIVAKYPWALATKRKHRGETIDIMGSCKSDIARALAMVAERA